MIASTVEACRSVLHAVLDRLVRGRGAEAPNGNELVRCVGYAATQFAPACVCGARMEIWRDDGMTALWTPPDEHFRSGIIVRWVCRNAEHHGLVVAALIYWPDSGEVTIHIPADAEPL